MVRPVDLVENEDALFSDEKVGRTRKMERKKTVAQDITSKSIMNYTCNANDYQWFTCW